EQALLKYLEQRQIPDCLQTTLQGRCDGVQLAVYDMHEVVRATHHYGVCLGSSCALTHGDLAVGHSDNPTACALNVKPAGPANRPQLGVGGTRRKVCEELARVRGPGPFSPSLNGHRICSSLPISYSGAPIK